jgi:ribosomal protein L34E
MQKAEIYGRYPISSVIIYNGSTVVHFLAGGFILLFLAKMIGSVGIAVSVLYVVLAFLEMYVIMPLKVCTNCVYFRTPDSRISTLFERRQAKKNGFGHEDKRIASIGNRVGVSMQSLHGTSHKRRSRRWGHKRRDFGSVASCVITVGRDTTQLEQRTV